MRIKALTRLVEAFRDRLGTIGAEDFKDVRAKFIELDKALKIVQSAPFKVESLRDVNAQVAQGEIFEVFEVEYYESAWHSLESFVYCFRIAGDHRIHRLSSENFKRID